MGDKHLNTNLIVCWDKIVLYMLLFTTKWDKSLLWRALTACTVSLRNSKDFNKKRSCEDFDRIFTFLKMSSNLIQTTKTNINAWKISGYILIWNGLQFGVSIVHVTFEVSKTLFVVQVYLWSSELLANFHIYSIWMSLAMHDKQGDAFKHTYG